ncbi:MAG: sigma-54-dependent Fis family transcriptional regulator [Acidobacteria bacterium]|nr:sigma-54-dependent Fis family transcriptional regulator [Acidobacteriota bacterium]
MSPSPSTRLGRILVVDDDAELASTMQEFLQGEGYAVSVAMSSVEAAAVHERNPDIAVAIVDLIMPVGNGLTVMEDLQRRNPDVAVIIMTGYGTIETAVEAVKRGAEDYITKPFDRDAIRKKVARLMEVLELRERVTQLESNLERYPSLENVLFVSAPMQRVVERARVAAGSEASVLLLGDTGTGKEMLARAIHASSPRAGGPFVAINCGALPRDLIESELFGVRRGAYTGAYADAPGIFVAATGGTVFLDEIGEMPKEVQVKLLRVLQEREVRPLGSTRSTKVDVRIVAATNRTLAALRSDFLREDFYYRVATVLIEIPPLRARPEDVLVLAQHFVTRIAHRCGRQISLARSAAELLLEYSFPGNVRELENLMESAAAVSVDNPQAITDRDLKPLLAETLPPQLPTAVTEHPLTLERLEQVAIQQALRLSDGNRTKAASLLGISRDTLHRKLRQYKDSTL